MWNKLQDRVQNTISALSVEASAKMLWAMRHSISMAVLRQRILEGVPGEMAEEKRKHPDYKVQELIHPYLTGKYCQKVSKYCRITEADYIAMAEKIA